MQTQLDLIKVPSNLNGKKVLLKPNLISAKAPPLACSNPVFVAAAASCFLVRGATVLLGDSPAFGSASHVLKKHGFVSALSGMNVKFVPFRRGVVKTLDCGVRLTVAAEPLSCDYFVNIPRIKAHEHRYGYGPFKVPGKTMPPLPYRSPPVQPVSIMGVHATG